MVDIKIEWHKSSGFDYMILKPDGPVTGQDWVEFFKIELEHYDKENLFFLVDLVGAEENTTAQEFSLMADQFINHRIKKVRIIVLTLNSEYLKLGKLFESMAEVKKLDLRVNFNNNIPQAIEWLKAQ